jgi:hypothetical protein
MAPSTTRRATDFKSSACGRVIEIAAQIRVNNFSMSSVDQLVDVSHGVQRAAVAPIGILFRLQIGLEDGFEHQHRRHHAPLDRGWRVFLTAAASHPAWGCIPAAREVVDRFDFSALASVRPTIALLRTLRCPRTSDCPLLLLRHWLCSRRRRTSERPSGTPCRTAHRNESQAISSLCRATPSVTSEHFLGLLGSSPIPPSSSLLAFASN